MEQMMVQAAAPVQGVQGVSFRALQGALAGQQPVGDGFAMLFQQLMGALNGEGDPMAALLAQMGQMQDDAEDEGVELGMQMMAEMLLSGNPQAAQILEQLGLEPEQVQALAQAGQDAGRVAQIEEMQAPVQQADTAAGEQPAEQAQDTIQVFAAGQNSQPEEPGEDGSLMQGEHQFRNAVQIAREKLGGQSKEEGQPVDVDALQAHANSYRFEPAQPMQKLEATMRPDPQEVVSQLRDGILDRLGKQDEFVVKLKPEGLGEITVSLTQQDGGIAMKLAASSPQVAKLISEQVMSLQNALRPLHAEVTEISTIAPQAAENAAQYSAFSEQQQQFSRQQQFTGGGAHQSARGSVDSGEEPVEWDPQVRLDDTLDAYI